MRGSVESSLVNIFWSKRSGQLASTSIWRLVYVIDLRSLSKRRNRSSWKRV
jgi:hypothetical protein